MLRFAFYLVDQQQKYKRKKNINRKFNFYVETFEFIWKLTFACLLNEHQRVDQQKKNAPFKTDGYQMVH